MNLIVKSILITSLLLGAASLTAMDAPPASKEAAKPVPSNAQLHALLQAFKGARTPEEMKASAARLITMAPDFETVQTALKNIHEAQLRDLVTALNRAAEQDPTEYLKVAGKIFDVRFVLSEILRARSIND